MRVAMASASAYASVSVYLPLSMSPHHLLATSQNLRATLRTSRWLVLPRKSSEATRVCSSNLYMTFCRSCVARAPSPTPAKSKLSSNPAITWKNCRLKTPMQMEHCMVVFASDLPSSVAPKKVQKGMFSQPHAMPHMSNAAFGHAASRKIPMKPVRSVKVIVHTLSFETMSVLLLASSSSASNASSFLPARRAARVIKYGGSSPMAVPAPQSRADGQRSTSWLKNVSEPSPYEPQPWKTHG
mmetsp:Transcript_14031/g.30453  ORF Transcript_14031/g.30453 Transcript_14031/m.30453 type:complete len:241 (+) Transcript_14031:814-1536(+)